MRTPSDGESARAIRGWFGWRFVVVVLLLGAVNAAGWWWFGGGVEKAVAEPPRVAEVEPMGEASTRPVISVTFTAPVVSAEGTPPPAAALIRLDPAVPGRALWAPPRQILFYPAKDLPHGQKIRIVLDAQLGAAVGTPLEGPREFEFTTESLKLVRVRQEGFTRAEQATLRLTFNDSVPSGEVVPYLHVRAPDGRKIEFEPAGDRGEAPQVEHSILCRGVRERTVFVSMISPVPAAPGAESVARVATDTPRVSSMRPAGYRRSNELSVQLSPEFRVTGLSGTEVFRESPDLHISFNQAVDPKQPSLESEGASGTGKARLEDFFSVSPEVSFRAVASGSVVKLKGEFRPGERYAVVVRPGLRTRNGATLALEHTQEMAFPDRRSQIAFQTEGTHLSSLGNLAVTIETANADTVRVQAYRVYPNNLVHYLEMGWYRENFTEPMGQKTYRLPQAPNELQDVTIDLRDICGGDPRGVWYVEAFSPHASDSRMLTVSDLGVTTKVAKDEILVWATSLRSARPVEGAQVSLRTSKNQLVAEAVTDREGLVRIPKPATSPQGSPSIVVLSAGADLSYVQLAESKLSLADFEVGGRSYLRRGYEAFVFSDRGVYRPGESVHLRALVTSPAAFQDPSPEPESASSPESGEWGGETWMAPHPLFGANGAAVLAPRSPPEKPEPRAFEPIPLEIQVVRPDGKDLRVLQSTLSTEGTVELALDLPISAKTGVYTARVRLPGEDGRDVLGRVTFRVEEYMPNRIRAEVVRDEATTPERVRPGDKAAFIVRGQYLFGLPAAECAVEARWSLSAHPFRHPDWKEFRFGGEQEDKVPVSRESIDASLNDQGEARVEVAIPRVATTHEMTLRLHASVMDDAGRPVGGICEVAVDPVDAYLGLRQVAAGAIEAGSSARFECVAVTPDGQLADIAAAEVTVSRIRWNWVYEKTSSHRYSWVCHQEVDDLSTRRVILSGGRGAFELTFDESSRYVVRASDPVGGAAAEVPVQVYYPGASRWMTSLERPERVEVSPIRSAFRPGEMARVIVRSPFPGTLLVTTETDRVEFARTYSMQEDSLEVEVPVPPHGSDGNFYVAAQVIRSVGVESPWMPHRAFGVAPVSIDRTDRQLQITLAGPDEIRPGSRGSLEVRVVHDDGEPAVGAELAIALVDEGILALTGYKTPDPMGFFYGKRALGVEMADNLGGLLEEIPLDRVRSKPGGDGPDFLDDGARDLNAVRARRVEPAVRWLGPVKTDEKGGAVVGFDVPEFTGELRFYAVASSEGRQFGAAARPIVVRSPFFFELGMPRFLAPGDSFVAPVRIFNQTGQSGSVSLEWMLDGLRDGLQPPEEGLRYASFHDSPLDIEAGGNERWVMPLEATERVGAATVKVVGSFEGDSLKEAYVEEVELAVRPAAPRTTEYRSGMVREGEPVEILPERDYLDGTYRYQLVASSFPVVELAGAIDYLIQYPYGCLEQTTSRVLPLVYLRDIIDQLGILDDPRYAAATSGVDLASLRRKAKSLDGYVLAGIDRLLGMQSTGGWFGWWGGGGSPWCWGSIYAGHFLIEAKASGYFVPQPELDALLEYLAKRVLNEGDVRSGVEGLVLEKAYATYVLALARRPELERMDVLLERARKSAAEPEELPGGAPNPRRASQAFPPTARYLLAGAYFLVGKADVATELLGEITEPEETRDIGGALRSPARETAILLGALLDVDAQNELIPTLVDRLRRYAKKGRWATTQENAFAVLALGKYARKLAPSSESFAAEVRIGDGEPAVLAHGQHRVFTGGGSVGRATISVSGPGALFYSWLEEGIPLDGEVEEKDSGLSVRRRLLDSKGKELDPTELRAGDVVIVELSLKSEQHLENVVVVDLLPAGFEVENPHLDQGATLVQGLLAEVKERGVKDRDIELRNPAYTSLRDDRVILFFDSIPASKTSIHHHVCRAVTRGEFQLPPVRAEAMYDPTLCSTFGSGKVVVK